MNASRYDRHRRPHLIDFACSVKPVRRQRELTVPQARGRMSESASAADAPRSIDG